VRDITDLLKRTQNVPYFPSCDLRKLAVADSSAFIECDRSYFDRFFGRRYSPNERPVVVISSKARDEIIDGSRDMLDLILANNYGFVLDIDELASRDSCLQDEISQILPGLSLLTSKSLIALYASRRGHLFFDALSEVLSLVNIVPVSPGDFSINRQVSATMEKIKEQYTSGNYSDSSRDNSKAINLLRLLRADFMSKYDELFHSRLLEVEENLGRGVINFYRMQQPNYSGSGISYVELLKQQSEGVMRVTFEKLVSFGLKCKLNGHGLRAVQPALENLHEEKLSRPSSTDFHVSAAYAYPFELTQIPLHRVSRPLKIEVISKDSDVSQLLQLRRDFFYYKKMSTRYLAVPQARALAN